MSKKIKISKTKKDVDAHIKMVRDEMEDDYVDARSMTEDVTGKKYERIPIEKEFDKKRRKIKLKKKIKK